MKIRLGLVSILSTFAISVFGNSIPNSPELIDSISSLKSTVSYSEILLYLLCIMFLVPFVYIVYLKQIKIHDKLNPYYFTGDYNAKNIIDYIEKLEVIFNKSFPKFKKSINQCNQDSAGDISKYSEAIDSNLFCIKLNGRKRLNVFWESSDPFLKVLILLLPIIVLVIILISYIYWGIGGLVFSMALQIFFMPLMLVVFSYMLKIFQFVFRKIGNELPSLQVSLFALDCLINRYVEKAFDKKTGRYYYYSTITKEVNLINESGYVTIFKNPNKDIVGVIEDYNV